MPDHPKRDPGSGEDPLPTQATAHDSAESGHAPIPRTAAPLPTRVGRYEITRILGQGGMGTVYLARQESPRRSVALKVIHANFVSPELLRRFGQESQVLGRLHHPGIAQVYEAGAVKDDRGHDTPFFAMEFVKGVPLTEYVERRRLGVRERLDLIARICDAVDHAHQKGVIHRDLKPANILVEDSGQPKILDFGVARATDSDIQQATIQTDIGQLIGTVPYMSPEQVSGDPSALDTRSDVYALGVIAYEMLAGRLPYDINKKMIHEVARIIREEEPTRLSNVSRTLRGDVETIIAKALEKDKLRRYQSAESFATDIRRFLKDEPITAHPASAWYQIRKFSRRNSGLVAGVAAGFVLLLAGLVGTSFGLGQAVIARDREALAKSDAVKEKEIAVAARAEADRLKDAAVQARESEAEHRQTAEAQRDKAEKIAAFMSELLDGVGPSVARGRDTTMLKEMMDAAAARIERGDLKASPQAELRLRGSIGATYRDLALYSEAEKMLAPAVDLARTTFPGDSLETANALSRLAQLLRLRGDLARAEPLFRESLAMNRRLISHDDADLAGRINDLAILLQTRGDLDGAAPLYHEAVEMWKRLFKGDNPDVAGGLTNLAFLLQARGDVAGAIPLARESLEMTRRLFPGDHPEVGNCMNNLAYLLQASGDLDAAEPLYRDSLAMMRRLFPGDHPLVATSLNNLSRLLNARGDLAGMEPLLREALDIRRRVFGETHQLTLMSASKLANLLIATDRYAEALPLAEACAAGRRDRFGPEADETREANLLLVKLYESWDKVAPGQGYDAKAAQWKAMIK